MNRVTARPSHPAWVEVDLAALAHNAAVIRRATPGGAQVGILVKANAYGHGREAAARAALAGGADWLVVATLDEGLALRAAGFDAPILVVYPIPPDGVAAAVAARLDLTAGGDDDLRRTLEAATGGPLRLHLEIDTGMGRGGIAPDGLVGAVARIDNARTAELAGAWSHLADGRDPERSGEQARRFENSLARLAATGRNVVPRHLVATEGLFTRSAPAYELVRIGLAFYGELGLDVVPSPELAPLAAELRPAMAVKARPVRIESLPAGSTVGYGSEWRTDRPSRIATLPVGYADGWARASWPGGSVLINGTRAPIVGRVSMDSICVDVTDIHDATLDAEAVLLGAQGSERITVAELARLRGTIPNEVLSTVGPRLPRVFRDEGLDR